MYVCDTSYGVDLTCRKTTDIKKRTDIDEQRPPTCDHSFEMDMEFNM